LRTCFFEALRIFVQKMVAINEEAHLSSLVWGLSLSKTDKYMGHCPAVLR
jgi:hypothetical protein